ncbi:TolC family protein [Flavobacteriaceae bacterium KMM 6897]|nr:TolC family protein [Flavobacteriaceae bacterium KMM 6897]MEB8344504.1 TolC family protein [Flavobacteriaceae bacterium KMM 6898]
MVHNILVFLAFLFVLMAQGQGLDSYLEQAEANNPEVQAFEVKYNISKEKVLEANSLPNTEVSAGYFVSEPETRTGAQKARFSIKQMLPWFGTITARENYAASLSEVDYLDIVITKRKLRLSVSQSYYKLYGIKEKQKVLQENIELLKTYERLALTSLEVGNASVVDILRLQIRQNELQEQKAVLGREYISEQTFFNKLMNRDGNAEIVVIDSLSLLVPDEENNKLEIRVHPELEKYDRLFESVQQLELLNQKDANPDLGFGLDYIPVAERSDMVFSDNGKDIVMPMISLSIPIFNNGYKSKTIQNQMKLQVISAEKLDRKNKLEALLNAAENNRESQRIKYNTQIGNLKQARDAEEILIKNYETGTIDFNDVLDIQELQLKFQLSQIESTTNYYLISATINYLMN